MPRDDDDRDGFEAQPEPFDARRLDAAKKRKRLHSAAELNSESRREKSSGRNNEDDLPSVDELPQPYNAKELMPAKRRATSPPPGDQPRARRKPGARARISEAERDAIRQRQLERERAEEEQLAAANRARGINDVVRQHYNNVPERGRDWRKTDSRIKGLRSFNNWVKSCIIQKFSPEEDHVPGARERGLSTGRELLVLDIGCGKGGDLGKWQQAPQPVQLYVGLDPADISIEQARGRYREMTGRGGGGQGGRGGGHHQRRPQRTYDAQFYVKDCYGESIEDVEVVRQVGFDTSPVGGRHGFDVVAMMFCMHYAFESEAKARMMLRNVAGALKKGGRFIGCIPNSDVIGEQVRKFNARKAEEKEKRNQQRHGDGDKSTTTLPADPQEEGEAEAGELEEGEAEDTAEWGNGIYRVRFPGKTPANGIFRPAFGWKYNFFLDEAVEEVPEYVVPWEAFRALAEDFNLELQYHKTFMDIWESEKDDEVLGPLSERMNVRERGRGPLLISAEEREAASFYVAFCFYKV